MNLIFAGTPEFAALALAALLDAGHRIPLVLTQPDRPAGRGLKLTFPPVKALALERGLRVEQPTSLRDPASQAMLHDLVREEHIDAMVVAAYGLILPQAVLDMPARGCVNIHASLLPRWRGAAPIQRAIEAGDTETGVGIMLMEAGLDTGPVLLERRTPIRDDDSGGTLHDRLAALGAEAIVAALARFDTLTPQPQTTTGVTYASKLAKSEGALDFRRPAIELARRIRAFDPFPGSQAALGTEIVKMWAAKPLPARASGSQPGEVLAVQAEGIDIACGDGVLRVTELQRAGGRRLSAQDFLAGNRVLAGDRFTVP
jgi:methionyl-tRNA formyltransferase